MIRTKNNNNNKAVNKYLKLRNLNNYMLDSV